MLIQKTPIIRNAEENRMKNGRASPVTVALLSIVLLSSFILLGLPPAKAQAPPPPPATLRITSLDALSNFIQDPNLTPGTSFVVDVNIDNVPAIQNSTYGGIQGFDITVNFDHTVLQPTGISHDAQHIPSCPSADTCLLDGKLTLLDQLCPPLTTCATGTARAVVTMLGSSNRFDTSSPPAAFNTGILFRIQFKVVGIGVTSIAVDTSSSQILGPLNSFPVPLPYTTVDASFDNTPPFGFSLSRVSGQVFVGKWVATNITVSGGTAGPVPVDLSVSGLPTGAVPKLNVTSGTTDYGASLNITTASTTPRGIYMVHIIGNCAGCGVNGAGFTTFTIFALTVRDIAVISVTPSVTSADIGLPVSVSVVVQNQGTTLETFAVNLWANSTVVASNSAVTLSAGSSQTVNLVWNTTAFSPGIYEVSARVPPAPYDLNTYNINSGGMVTLAFADAAVTNVAATPQVVNPGQSVTTSITVANHGVSAENFTVNVFAVISGGQKSSLASLQVTMLVPGQSTTLTASWSTTGFSSGTYTVHIEIPSLKNETNLADNLLDSSSVRLNAAPTASFTITTTVPTAGQAVSFDASQSSDSDGTIPASGYSWNFGDGTTGTGKVVSHNFQNAGSFSVILTVTDNDGATQTKTQSVTIASSGSSLASILTSPVGLAGIGVAVLLIIIGAVLFTRRRSSKTAS